MNECAYNFFKTHVDLISMLCEIQCNTHIKVYWAFFDLINTQATGLVSKHKDIVPGSKIIIPRYKIICHISKVFRPNSKVISSSFMVTGLCTRLMVLCPMTLT
jgi:hypothetical protein